MVKLAAGKRSTKLTEDVRRLFPETTTAITNLVVEDQKELNAWRSEGYGYWLLVFAGLGIFCGAWARVRSSRCTFGCRTRWKVRRRSAH